MPNRRLLLFEILLSFVTMFTTWILPGAAILLVAYLIAAYSKSQGYFFWRTFILCTLAFTAIVVMVYNFFKT